jgi:hypothetical protein
VSGIRAELCGDMFGVCGGAAVGNAKEHETFLNAHNFLLVLFM